MRVTVLYTAALTCYTCAASCFVRNLQVQQDVPLDRAQLVPLPNERPRLGAILSLVYGSKPFWKLLTISLIVAIGARAALFPPPFPPPKSSSDLRIS